MAPAAGRGGHHTERWEARRAAIEDARRRETEAKMQAFASVRYVGGAFVQLSTRFDEALVAAAPAAAPAAAGGAESARIARRRLSDPGLPPVARKQKSGVTAALPPTSPPPIGVWGPPQESLPALVPAAAVPRRRAARAR